MKQAITALKWLGGLLALALLGTALFYFWASAPASDMPAVSFSSAPVAAPTSSTFSLLTYNVGYAAGAENNSVVGNPIVLFSEEEVATNLATIIDTVRTLRPDVLALQEIDYDAARSFEVDQLEVLSEQADYPAMLRGVSWNKNYVPFPGLRPSRHFGKIVSGQGMLSRLPVVSHEQLILSRADTPFYYDAFYIDRLAQVMVVETPAPVAVINVHLEHLDKTARRQQLTEVMELYSALSRKYPTVVAGDFNSVLDEIDVIRDYDDAIADFMSGYGLIEVLAGSGVLTSRSDDEQWKLDHIFYNPTQLELIEGSKVAVPGNPSDHHALMATFAIPQ